MTHRPTVSPKSIGSDINLCFAKFAASVFVDHLFTGFYGTLEDNGISYIFLFYRQKLSINVKSPSFYYNQSALIIQSELL